MSNPITEAQALEAEGRLAEAIQAYDDILNTTDGTSRSHLLIFDSVLSIRGGENFLQRNGFFAHAHQLDPTTPTSEMQSPNSISIFRESRSCR